MKFLYKIGLVLFALIATSSSPSSRVEASSYLRSQVPPVKVPEPVTVPLCNPCDAPVTYDQDVAYGMQTALCEYQVQYSLTYPVEQPIAVGFPVDMRTGEEAQPFPADVVVCNNNVGQVERFDTFNTSRVVNRVDLGNIACDPTGMNFTLAMPVGALRNEVLANNDLGQGDVQIPQIIIEGNGNIIQQNLVIA